jgi:hypothetical protein
VFGIGRVRPHQTLQQPAQFGHGVRQQVEPQRGADRGARSRVSLGCGVAQHGEIGMGQYGQGDMAVPAGPRAHLVLVQPHFPLGHLKAVLDGSAQSRLPHQFGQRCRRQGEGEIKGEVLRLVDLAADQQALVPAGRGSIRKVQQKPLRRLVMVCGCFRSYRIL